MEAIKGLVQDFLGKLQQNQVEPKQKIQIAWQEILAKKYKTHCQIVSLRKDCLIVNVDSSVWLYELNLKKEILIKKLNGELNQRVIEDIYFRIGDVNNTN